MQPIDFKDLGCKECARGCDLGFDFSMALQPIIDVESRTIFAQEALARGLNGESAGEVFKHVNETNLYRFDQSCRVKAIRLAAELNVDSYLSINFLPNAIYRPELCIRTTLAAAETYAFDKTKIIFEFTENERIVDQKHLINIISHYEKVGFQTAIDDFGSGYNGLAQLADLKTQITKIDMELIRNIDKDPAREIIVRNMVKMLTELGQRVIAEGIETDAEYRTLRDMGITLYQGFYFAKPAFESLADVHWPD
ncbi:EAL domain-containing protein [Marinomonas gallaica]|uniref:EAL domain-containing protein n=1 Tax=Marinomonas gallaica TaxID=1806667 RepID=UPI003CE570F1